MSQQEIRDLANEQKSREEGPFKKRHWVTDGAIIIPLSLIFGPPGIALGIGIIGFAKVATLIRNRGQVKEIKQEIKKLRAERNRRHSV